MPAFRGFSLIEVLTVMLILAILLTLAMPTYRGITARAQLRAAADLLRSDLEQARTDARERSRAVYISFWRSDDGRQWCWGSAFSDCDCRIRDSRDPGACYVDFDSEIPDAGGVLHAVDATRFANVTLDALPFGGKLRFSALRPETLAGNATFSTNGQRLRVVASSYGRLRLFSPSGGAYIAGYAAC
jgi:type IV fimbrial biogenesis protein FimT